MECDSSWVQVSFVVTKMFCNESVVMDAQLGTNQIHVSVYFKENYVLYELYHNKASKEFSMEDLMLTKVTFFLCCSSILP